MIQILAAGVVIMINVLNMLSVVLIVEMFLGGIYHFTWKNMFIVAGCSVVLEIVTENVMKEPTELMITIVVLGFLMMVVFLLAKEKKIRTAFLVLLAELMHLQWGSVGDLMEMLFGVDEYYISVGGAELSPFLPLIEVALFGLLLWLRKYAAERNISLTLNIGERVVLGVFCIFAPIIKEVLTVLEDVLQNPTYNVAWVVFVLALNMAVVYGIVYRKRMAYYRELSTSYRDEFDKEYRYFKEYKDNNQEMARFRHDWNNHMIVIQDLFEQGKYEEAQRYFKALPQTQNMAKRKILTGNETVDTIFAAKSDLLELNSIAVELDGRLERLSRMETVDICILFANLLDNAIEALAQHDGERTLFIKVTETAGVMLLVVKNPMSGTLSWDGEALKTTKEDSTRHGIGLGNVQTVVSKYRGECDIKAENNMFIVKIMLPYGM